MPHRKVGLAESRARPRTRPLDTSGVARWRERGVSFKNGEPSLQSAIQALSLDERLELVEYIESTVESSPIEVTEEQKTMIRSRAAEVQVDPSIGLTGDEIKARLAARRA